VVWEAHISSSSSNYTESTSDHSLFIENTATSFTILLVYVDNVIIVGDSLSEFQSINVIMHSSFKIKDLGQLKYFLGLEVAHSSQGISLCHRKYCIDLLTDTGYLACKPVFTPFDPSSKLHTGSSAPYADVPSFRRLIGMLLYLNNTRPYITFATQQLSQFLTSPTKKHLTAATRILRYLKKCHGQGLMFPRDSFLYLSGYSDADWAGYLDSRRSISGQWFFSWKILDLLED